MISVFFILLSSLQWNLHTHFIYLIKILTEPSGLLYWKVNLWAVQSFFGLKEIAGFYITYYVWVVFTVVISWVSCRKYENLPQFNADWLASLKTWYYFRLCFSSNCSGFDLTVIKPVSHIIHKQKLFSKQVFSYFTYKKNFGPKNVGGTSAPLTSPLPPPSPQCLPPCTYRIQHLFYTSAGSYTCQGT